MLIFKVPKGNAIPLELGGYLVEGHSRDQGKLTFNIPKEVVISIPQELERYLGHPYST